MDLGWILRLTAISKMQILNGTLFVGSPFKNNTLSLPIIVIIIMIMVIIKQDL